MEVKQEPLNSYFDEPHTATAVSNLNAIKKEPTIKQEPQEEELLSYLPLSYCANNVPEFFRDTPDLISINRIEITKKKCKSEDSHTYHDSSTFKSENMNEDSIEHLNQINEISSKVIRKQRHACIVCKKRNVTEIPSTSQYNDFPSIPLSQFPDKKKEETIDYSSVRLNRRHFACHFGKRYVTCRFCGKTFIKKSEYAEHFVHFVKRRQVAKPIRSFLANTHSYNLTNGPLSLTNLVKQNEQKKFYCEVCLKGFQYKSTLKTHSNIHTAKKEFVCAVCSKHFLRKASMTRHMKIHTGEKPFHCEKCPLRFSRKADLFRHSKIHTGEKPFECEICSRKFMSQYYLVRHAKKIHANFTQYRCNFCPAEFLRKVELDEHSKMHEGEKRFQCESCSKRFLRKADLVSHTKTHTGEKPFGCELCTKKFTRRADLDRHFRTHTGEKPYQCGVCFKQFTQKPTLNQHLLRHSGQNQLACETLPKQI